METRSAKRKRLLMTKEDEARRHTNGEDRISDLPDAVLHQILLPLPINTIARMSVLSKRWRWIWSSFPDLDFTSTLLTHHTDGYFRVLKKWKRKRKSMFFPVIQNLDFITHVLASRDKRSYLRILRLFSEQKLSFSGLNHLIRLAVRHNVQELDLEVATEDYFNFPRSVISCKSLKVLTIKSRSPGFRLPPSSIMKSGFATLDTLRLSRITFHDQSSALLDLFTESSFPLLKKLHLFACSGLKSLRIACRELEELTLEQFFQLNDLEIFCGKLERLKVDRCFDHGSKNSWVKIDAPRIKVLVWENNPITQRSFVGEVHLSL